jgi:hypothetical protein
VLRSATPWFVGAILLTLAAPPGRGAEPSTAPDPATLVKLGQQTIDRLAAGSAEWDTSIEMNGQTIRVETVWSRGAWKKTLVGVADERRIELFRIVQSGGLWAVWEQGKPFGLYRPYEAPLTFPGAYVMLALSEPLRIINVEMLSQATYDFTARDVASYHMPLSPAMRRSMEELLAGVERYKDDPKMAGNAQLQARLAGVREKLAKGIPLKVSLTTGLIEMRQIQDIECRFSNFRWLEAVDPQEFQVKKEGWADFSKPVMQDKAPEAFAMFGYFAAWRPGLKTNVPDAHLLNLDTGDLRRIPYGGMVSMPGCFLKDRSQVVVSGQTTTSGDLGLYKVDLKTGENTPLLGGDGGFAAFLFPTLSPDGSTLALIAMDAKAAASLQFQVWLVDLKTGKPRKLSDPADVCFLSWLPDGSGLILVDRKSVDMKKPAIGTICRLDLEGKKTPIRPGDNPLLLGDGKTILFQDAADGLWKTCDLQGGGVKLFGDGMKNYGFPSLGPDGRRILWMRFGGSDGPAPVVVDIATGAVKEVKHSPGLWSMPAWR